MASEPDETFAAAGISGWGEIKPSICEVLLNVLVEAGLHVEVPRGVKPPRVVVALYEAADAYYKPLIDVALGMEQSKAAHLFLQSIASADAKSEQAEWMVAQAREGLRRSGGRDLDAVAVSGGSTP